jgi:hypothetical protein
MRKTLAVLAAVLLTGCSGGQHGTGSTAPDVAGAEAATYLRGDVATSLLVRVDYAAGMAPVASALAFLEAELALRVDKPLGVRVVLGGELVAPLQSVYTVADCLEIERRNRTVFSSGTQAVIYVTCLPGMSERDLLGVTTFGWSDSASSFTVFEETLRENVPLLLVAPDVLEGAVLLHESGHLLGLVGHGTPALTRHEDPSWPAHCTNEGCLMAAQSSSWGLVSTSLDLGRVGFCEACLADLRANGGR